MLSGDRRVRRSYLAWRRARGLDGAWLHSMRTRRQRAKAQPLDEVLQRRSVNDAEALAEAIHRERALDLSELERLVREDLRLPYRWLAHLLLVQFRVWCYTAATGEGLGLRASRPVQTSLKPGRRPKGGGADIRRNVGWYYRHEIQQPPEFIGKLAKEWEEAAQRNTRANSVVQTGIKRAKQILATVVALPPATI